MADETTQIMNKYGVPLDGKRGNILQPKVKYKFRVWFSNFGPLSDSGIDLTQSVVSCGTPTLAQSAVEIHSYVSRAYYAAKPEWSPVQLVVRNDVTNAVSKLVGYQMQKQHNHFDQTNPLSGANYKFTTYIQAMDGSGSETAIETWTLGGCFLTNVSMDSYDYSSSDPMQITMDIRYDSAFQGDDLMAKSPNMVLDMGKFLN